MKTQLAILALALGLSAQAQVPVVLEWNYTNGPSTNLWFEVYKGTNATQPMETWTLITNVVGTNFSVELSLPPGEYYFAAKASNFWGRSVFSNVASTPAPPRGDSVLSIRRK